MNRLRIQLRVVFYRDGPYWIAHCLEMDVMGHGHTQRQAFIRMNQAIAIQLAASIQHRNLANIFMPADGRFFGMYFAGRNMARGGFVVRPAARRPAVRLLTSTPAVVVEGVQAREYVAA